ncbi:hypothetical protein IV203_028801 [Nitzschia inconspicua]|uniref:Uncharacterized protein n=1 Tax=Nitzschia inconspicua TaxID=303405 RepID=A0A9K3Q069_9STRA|nr:hypothetical protein IV203_028801 [Nitzschia inconspicua]
MASGNYEEEEEDFYSAHSDSSNDRVSISESEVEEDEDMDEPDLTFAIDTPELFKQYLQGYTMCRKPRYSNNTLSLAMRRYLEIVTNKARKIFPDESYALLEQSGEVIPQSKDPYDVRRTILPQILKNGKLNGCILKGHKETGELGLITTSDIKEGTPLAVDCGVVWSEDRYIDWVNEVGSSETAATLLHHDIHANQFRHFFSSEKWNTKMKAWAKSRFFVVDCFKSGNEVKYLKDISWENCSAEEDVEQGVELSMNWGGWYKISMKELPRMVFMSCVAAQLLADTKLLLQQEGIPYPEQTETKVSNGDVDKMLCRLQHSILSAEKAQDYANRFASNNRAIALLYQITFGEGSEINSNPQNERTETFKIVSDFASIGIDPELCSTRRPETLELLSKKTRQKLDKKNSKKEDWKVRRMLDSKVLDYVEVREILDIRNPAKLFGAPPGEKAHGVFAKRDFEEGDPVLCYAGYLVDHDKTSLVDNAYVFAVQTDEYLNRKDFKLEKFPDLHLCHWRFCKTIVPCTMDGRFPFGNPRPGVGNPFTGKVDPAQVDARMRAALGLGGVSSMEEALYLQMHAAEQRRDFELQQMLVRERLAQESRMESIRQGQQIKAIGDQLQEFPDLQQQYSRLLLGDTMNRGAEDRMLLANRLRAQAEEELRRRQQHLFPDNPAQPLAQQHSPIPSGASASLKPPPSSIMSSIMGPQRVPTINQAMLRDIAANSLAGNAVRRGEVDKRKFAQPDADAISPTAAVVVTAPVGKKRSRSHTSDSTDLVQQSPIRQKKSKQKPGPKPKKRQSTAQSPKSSKEAKKLAKKSKKSETTPRRKYTKHGKASLLPEIKPAPNGPKPPPTLRDEKSNSRRTIEDLLDVAHIEDKSDTVALILTRMREDSVADWPESDDEASDTSESKGASILPIEEAIRLPNFYSVLPKLPEEPSIVIPPVSNTKFKGLLDDDSLEGTAAASKNDQQTKPNKHAQNGASDDAFKDLPYLVDKWWPSSLDIKKERKSRGEVLVDDDANENTMVVGSEQKFRVNVEKIKENVSHQVQPGVLEKVPHCKIHRMLLQRRKSAAPELVYCWQVTELYPNDIMVCCSQCGTWRHAACGGHHKSFSVREATEKPFIPICDRCFEEDKILEVIPVAKKRLDRQRSEQIRRALSTSAAMRQASFSKHGGSYKWPLGSVSATHIGGHTRSVHTRHDKAEKQWSDMTAKLSKGYGNKPKDKVKHRTKELERLLVSIEDAEGHTDRHNMLVFLMNDTRGNHPTGYEEEDRNLFDPADDMNDDKKGVGRDFYNDKFDTNHPGRPQVTCIRAACPNKPRFDSYFCSDACGVCTLENDLLRTFQYSSDMHPSSLRH